MVGTSTPQSPIIKAVWGWISASLHGNWNWDSCSQVLSFGMGLSVVRADWYSPAKTNSWDTPFSSSQTQCCLWLHTPVTAECKRLWLSVLALLLTTQGSCLGNRLRQMIQPKNNLPERRSWESRSWRRAAVARRWSYARSTFPPKQGTGKSRHYCPV